MNSFYSDEELRALGFKSVGKNVLISRKASFYGCEKMVIGDHVRIDDFCLLSGKITLGSYIHIASYSGLFAGDVGIEMKDFSGISSRCAVYAVSDDFSGEYMTNPTVPDRYKRIISGKVTLGRHVLIAAGSTILPDVTIGEGTSVWSMSLVNRSLPEWGMYFGVPCRKVGDRSKKLLELEKEFLGEK